MKISIIIPVKNGAQTLKNCLQSIRDQRISGIEVIVLDSMSTDGSKEIALSYGAIVKDIPLGKFNHGLTRNLGAAMSSGDLLYYTVQDAWLPDQCMLGRMAAHFKDETVHAVAGHQVTPWGHLDKNPASWFKRFTEPVISIRQFPEHTFKNLSAKDQFENSGWDDVNAMYRKAALVQIPFRETNFSEDWLWANDALQNGMKILYDPSLVVNHYHHMRFGYMFRAKFIMNYYFYKFFMQLPTIPWSIMGAIRASYIILKRKEVPMLKKPFWIIHNLIFHLSYFLSVLVFRLAYAFGQTKILDKVYRVICKDVPQGRTK